jgi:hypothetical protein
MNEKGYYNRAGKPLNRNALKPDWELFRGVEHTPDTLTDHNARQIRNG